jgi:hypothetical protein
MYVRPVAIGLVLCEHAIVDEKTHNVTTVSCFSRRVVEGPVEFMPPIFVVFTLVDGHGTMPAKLVIERLDTLETAYERAFTLTFADSLKEVFGIFRVRAQAFPVFGSYQALLIVGSEAIAQKRFSITPKESKS